MYDILFIVDLLHSCYLKKCIKTFTFLECWFFGTRTPKFSPRGEALTLTSLYSGSCCPRALWPSTLHRQYLYMSRFCLLLAAAAPSWQPGTKHWSSEWMTMAAVPAIHGALPLAWSLCKELYQHYLNPHNSLIGWGAENPMHPPLLFFPLMNRLSQWQWGTWPCRVKTTFPRLFCSQVWPCD